MNTYKRQIATKKDFIDMYVNKASHPDYVSYFLTLTFRFDHVFFDIKHYNKMMLKIQRRIRDRICSSGNRNLYQPRMICFPEQSINLPINVADKNFPHYHIFLLIHKNTHKKFLSKVVSVLRKEEQNTLYEFKIALFEKLNPDIFSCDLQSVYSLNHVCWYVAKNIDFLSHGSKHDDYYSFNDIYMIPKIF